MVKHAGGNMHSILLMVTLGITMAEAKPSSKAPTKEDSSEESKSKKKSSKKKSSTKTVSKKKVKTQKSKVVTKKKDDSKTQAIKPVTGAKRSGPKKAKVQTNVHRNVGSERKPGAVKPVTGAKRSGPKKAKVQTDVHRNVGSERKPEAVKPVTGAKRSSPKKARVQTDVHRNVGSERNPTAVPPVQGRKKNTTKREVVRNPPKKKTSSTSVPYKRAPVQKQKTPPQKKRAPVVVEKSVHTPQGWNPNYHRMDIPREYSSLDPRRWGAGYVYYNPPKNGKAKVVNQHRGKKVSKGYTPKREVDRGKRLSFGARGMSYRSGYVDGGEYIDVGVGVALGYRPVEALGLEVSYSQFSQNLGGSSPDRLNTPLQTVGQVYLFPWTKVSPFFSAGYAWNQIDVDDYYLVNGEGKQAIQEGVLTGPVFGAGVEYAFSKRFGVSAEGRYLMYNNLQDEDPARDNGLTLTTGLNLYF